MLSVDEDDRDAESPGEAEKVDVCVKKGKTVAVARFGVRVPVSPGVGERVPDAGALCDGEP